MDNAEVRACYLGAAQAFLELVEQVPEAAWSNPALGEWDVRGLTGHASRALTTVETYLAAPPATGPRLDGPVAYFLTIRGDASPDGDCATGPGDRRGPRPRPGHGCPGTRPTDHRASSGTLRTTPSWPLPPER